MSEENPESIEKHLDAEIICAGLSKPVVHQQLNFALSHLDISNRELTHIDGSVLAPYAQTILHIVASYNKLQSVGALSALRALQHADCSHNHIASVSDWVGSASLISLTLDFNSIASAPALSAFSKLTTLSLNDNKLTSLDGLELPSSLESLFLCRNGLTSLAGVVHASSVTELDISENAVESVEGLDRFINLTTLRANHNKIVALECIRAYDLPQLSAITLDHNSIDQISAFISLDHLSGLTSVTVSENPFIAAVDAAELLVELCCRLPFVQRIDGDTVFPSVRQTGAKLRAERAEAARLAELERLAEEARLAAEATQES